MMASIPNMRSTPLPVPTKTLAAGESAAGAFAVPASPAPAPEQLCAVAPPLELLEGIVPQLLAPEGDEDAKDGDEASSPRTDKASSDDGQPDGAILVPFVPQLPGSPVPQVQTVSAPGGESVAAEPTGLPGIGKKVVPAPDGEDVPTADAGTPDLEAAADAVVKALLQRKTSSGKQVAARPASADAAKADPAPAKAATRAQASPAPTPAPQLAAPLATIEPAQPTLSPTNSQPAPVADDKVATVDGTRTADLAVERKLDLSRDSAWLDRLARDIARSASDDSPLRFRLHPQTLGSLQVELQQGDRGAAVRMTVDTEAARQILSDAQPRLAAEARAQGVRIAETHVDLSGSGRHAPGDQRRQDEARQTPLIRTAPGADASGSARASTRARLDRYA